MPSIRRVGSALALAATLGGTLAAGEAQAQDGAWYTYLGGAGEGNQSGARGYSRVTLDGDDLTIFFRWSGLTAPTTIAHVHCCTAAPRTGNAIPATPVPSFPGFPAGVFAGSYTRTFDLTLESSYNPGFVAAAGGIDAARTRLLDGMTDSRAYLNIHTTTFPMGEIRGYYQVVPEPGTWALLGTGLVGLGVVARRRRQTA